MSMPRVHDELRLVSTRSAINCAGLFVVSTLIEWKVRFILRDAVAVTEELVTAAVNATGIPEARVHWTKVTRIEYITVRILGFEDSIRIEVWDSAPNRPALPDDADSPIKRGAYPTDHGKVVWADIPLYPHRPQPRPEPPPEQFAQDPGLLRRVRDGLDAL